MSKGYRVRSTRAEKAKYVNQVLYLANRGYRPGQIASELGLSLNVVKQSLEQVKRQWELDREDYYAALDKELASIDQQETVLWEQWELSKRAEVQTKRETIRNHRDIVGEGPAVIETTSILKAEGLGDMNIMSQITRLREQRLKLKRLMDGPTTQININTQQAIEETHGYKISRATQLALMAAIGVAEAENIKQGNNVPASHQIIDSEPNR